MPPKWLKFLGFHEGFRTGQPVFIQGYGAVCDGQVRLFDAETAEWCISTKTFVEVTGPDLPPLDPSPAAEVSAPAEG